MPPLIKVHYEFLGTFIVIDSPVAYRHIDKTNIKWNEGWKYENILNSKNGRRIQKIAVKW